MKILGIDPGTATTGYGVISKQKENLKVLDFGCITTEANSDFGKRLDTIYKDITKVIKLHKPDVIACEELFFFKNAKTAMKVSHARGVILLASTKSKAPVFEYTPLQVKLKVTGKGRADKKEVQKIIAEILGLDEVPKPDDAADALAVAVCHGIAHDNKNTRAV